MTPTQFYAQPYPEVPHFDRALAQVRLARLRQTHVIVGDHAPERRVVHGNNLDRRTSLTFTDLRAAFAESEQHPTPISRELYDRARGEGFDMKGYAVIEEES